MINCKSKTKEYAGTDIEYGTYKIIFEPVEVTVSTVDRVKEMAEDSCWGGNYPFASFDIEKIKDLTTKEFFPYICSKCNTTVVKKDEIDKFCSFCGNKSWIKR